jgi:predicted type IV restriction endonuclease
MQVTDQSVQATTHEQSAPTTATVPVVRAPRVRPAIPKWEVDTRARVRTAIQKFARPLADLAKRDANEGDTRLFVTDFLCDALGFDKYAELTTEYQVRGEFADYGIRLDKNLVAFIEVKRVSTKLGARHLRQVEMYAVNEGVEWMLLTNGAIWQVWHLMPGMPVMLDMVLEVDLLGTASLPAKAADMFYLSREAMRRDQLDELWKARSATSARALAAVIRSNSVIDLIRKEIRRVTGHRAEGPELLQLSNETVLRPEL